MTDTTPVLYEVDVDTHEATGVVHPFCSDKCRAASSVPTPTGIMLVGGLDEITCFCEDTHCETCGTRIDTPEEGARKAAFAEIDIDVRVLIKVPDKGDPEIRVRGSMSPASLARSLAKSEREPGQGPWWEGGVAILDPSDAPNGRALVAKTEKFATELMRRMTTAATDTQH